ncbi:hypothetical protein [Fodinicola feengrottensis]|uniref:hypothetical protein n=1 Tax=Fodinicola feengrottensis TaxID=435914 RepID=UPI0013D894EB|nr:hypothetical protein [Fodinicola feengrottensis]
MAEYQTNTDMAFVIRLALAQFAEVLTDAQVLSVARDGEGIEVDVEGRDPLYAQNVIDARGLGDPYAQAVANGATILTFPQFMQRMATPWPLRALRRVSGLSAVAIPANAWPSPYSASRHNRLWLPLP